jgi:hypothetical protein
MWGPRQRGDRPRLSDGVAGECEMFLDGVWVEHEAEQRRRVPPWAWVSVLSHSDENRLTALAGDERVNVLAELRAWWDAVAFLAGEILDTARGLDLSPEQLQRTRLIPLELELAARDANGHDGMPRDPRALAAVVVAALEDGSGPRR